MEPFMIKQFKELAKRTEIEAQWWKWAAWTAPFVALALLVFEHWIGHSDWISTTLYIITVVFFTVAVMWWWWALAKITAIILALKRTTDSIETVILELQEIKVEVKKGLE